MAFALLLAVREHAFVFRAVGVCFLAFAVLSIVFPVAGVDVLAAISLLRKRALTLRLTVSYFALIF